jgi:hypothetical protein
MTWRSAALLLVNTSTLMILCLCRDLSSNQLEGTVPTSWSNITSAETMWVQSFNNSDIFRLIDHAL